MKKYKLKIRHPVIGVPITFLDKYNPDEFEIVGMFPNDAATIPTTRLYNDFKEMRQDMTYTGGGGGKINYCPVLSGKPTKGNFEYNPETGEYVHSAYARIAIRRK